MTSLSSIPLDQICYDDRGLVPAIVQDYLDGTVLMMAWMNRDSLEKQWKLGVPGFGADRGRNYGPRGRHRASYNFV